MRADNAVTEGARKVLGVMHKDLERYPATGGWGFEGFGGGDAGNRVVGANAETACFSCHHQPSRRRRGGASGRRRSERRVRPSDEAIYRVRF